ncbi:MAG TPA: helix-turn-helix transcriptional regulator [bacterium]|nr:helix-turn-helix transcriptional regulator [bacterium]
MEDEHALVGVLPLIYEAALDPDRWEACLAGMVTCVEATSAVLLLPDYEQNAVVFLRSAGIDPAVWPSFDEYYWWINPYAEFFATYEGTYYSSHELRRPGVATPFVYDEVMPRSEYYNDWLGPQGINYHLGAFVYRQGAMRGQLDFERQRQVGPFGVNSLEVLERLYPHVCRALQVGATLGYLGRQATGAQALLDGLPVGVVLIDAYGRPAFFNKRAESLMAAEPRLRLEGGRLVAEGHRDQVALEALLELTVRTGRGQGLHPGGALRLHGLNGRSPLRVLVAPVPASDSPLSLLSPRRICAAVLISEPGAPDPLDAAVLRLLYHLTPAEARLAVAVAEGRELTEIAEAFGIARNTARAQLRTIYDKTGVRRQADLVRLLLSGPAAFAPRPL